MIIATSLGKKSMLKQTQIDQGDQIEVKGTFPSRNWIIITVIIVSSYNIILGEIHEVPMPLLLAG